LAAPVINAYVEKQRKNENNLQRAAVQKPTEVGALWSEPLKNSESQDDDHPLSGGHFFLPAAKRASASVILR
jgi:hypothetical protein